MNNNYFKVANDCMRTYFFETSSRVSVEAAWGLARAEAARVVRDRGLKRDPETVISVWARPPFDGPWAGTALIGDMRDVLEVAA